MPLLFLPPYSPFLNPIERHFSQVKSYVKKWPCDNNNKVIATSNLHYGSIIAARYQLLLEAINYAISHVTTSDVRQYLEYSRRYYQNIFQPQPIDFEQIPKSLYHIYIYAFFSICISIHIICI